MPDAAENSLGLNFDQLKLDDQTSPEQNVTSPAKDNLNPPAPAPKERKKPYVNPERVKTGGAQRDKLSEEALSERMARMREQNEKIKQRRLDVQADEEAFRKTQEVERVRIAQNKRIQDDIDRAREQNARRKMDKIQSREWDSGKPAAERRPPATQNSAAPAPAEDGDKAKYASSSETPVSSSRESGTWIRGGGPRGHHPRGRGRGRGRGSLNASSGGAGKQSVQPPQNPDQTSEVLPTDTGAEKASSSPAADAQATAS